MEHTEGHALIFLPESLVQCTREMPILCLLLMLGTLWLGYTLYLIKRRCVLLNAFIGTKFKSQFALKTVNSISKQHLLLYLLESQINYV